MHGLLARNVLLLFLTFQFMEFCICCVVVQLQLSHRIQQRKTTYKGGVHDMNHQMGTHTCFGFIFI